MAPFVSKTKEEKPMRKRFQEMVFVSAIMSCICLGSIYFCTTWQMTIELIVSVITVCFLMSFVLSGQPNAKELNEDDGREAAMRPRPPKEMLYKKPVGFCFGSYKGKYVCKRIDTDGSILVQGSSGCGKSATIIQEYIINPQNTESNSLVLDLKHELVDKCVMPEDVYGPENPTGKSIILDPLDRHHGYGWDPFYRLNDKSTETEVLDVMDTIALSIIPPAKGDSQVWSLAAQQFLRGALAYFYKVEKLRTLPECIAAMKSAPIQEIVERILTGASTGGVIYATMISFKDMADETITSLNMTLSQRTVQYYTSPDLQWCLGANPRKCCPEDMLKHNIFLCLPESKLDQWGQLIFLVFNQYFTWAMDLPEKSEDPDRPYMACILDETVALLAGVGANIPKLAQMLRIGARGKGITMLICVQSIAGLEAAIGDKSEVKDMISNLTYKYILDSCDNETSEEIAGWIGEYRQRKVSVNGNGKNQKSTVSYGTESIVKNEELMKLVQTGEAILISSQYGYMRLKKEYVFKNKYFKKLLKNVQDAKRA